MDLPALQALAEQLLKRRKAHIDREKGSIYYHGQRVARTALLLRERIFPEDDSRDGILTAAAWFHDVGKDVGPHARTGAVLARALLAEHCTPEELDEICALILLHHENNCSPWVKLLQDADLIDHFGTQGIWIQFARDLACEGSPADTLAYIRTDWAAFCAKHRARLNYSLSTEIYDEKIAYMNAFFARLRIESEGGIVEPEGG
jgi:uncharacterized protein